MSRIRPVDSGLAAGAEHGNNLVHISPADSGLSTSSPTDADLGQPGPCETDSSGPKVIWNDQPADQIGLECSKQVRKMPSHLQDYICYQAATQDPSTQTPTLEKVSSGKPYPIANYVTCNKFLDAHKCYLSAITNMKQLKRHIRERSWPRK